MMARKFITTLLMPRRFYDVANLLYKNNLLEKYFIDFYYNKSKYSAFKILDKILPTSKQNIYKKYAPQVDNNLINSSWTIGTLFRIGLKLYPTGNTINLQLFTYKYLNRKVIAYLKNSVTANGFYGVDIACYEVFDFVKGNNLQVVLVMEQCIAPRLEQIKVLEMQKEHMSRGAYQKLFFHLQGLAKREMAEWEMADIILVPSNYVRKAVINYGVPVDKVRLVPYGYTNNKSVDDKTLLKERFNKSSQPFIVLFVGNATYRKGFYDLLKVAELLKDDVVEIRVAGTLTIQSGQKIPSNVKLLGTLQRTEVNREYRNADIFFLPSYLEGSAMVTYEAMSWGLPFIGTLESGSQYVDGENSFLHQPGDVNGMSKSIRRLSVDATIRRSFSENAFLASREYTLEKYETNLRDILE